MILRVTSSSYFCSDNQVRPSNGPKFNHSCFMFCLRVFVKWTVHPRSKSQEDFRQLFWIQYLWSRLGRGNYYLSYAILASGQCEARLFLSMFLLVPIDKTIAIRMIRQTRIGTRDVNLDPNPTSCRSRLLVV